MSKIDEKVVCANFALTTQNKSVTIIDSLVRDFRTATKADSILKEPSYEQNR